MRDFFARQDRARAQTRVLVALFALAVALIIPAVYALVRLPMQWEQPLRGASPLPFWEADLFFKVALGTLLLILGGSLYKIRELRAGGPQVARLLGARPIPPDTCDPLERRLRNIAEEMAVAAGMPVPELFLLERERGINAFAAGYGPGDAAVCVTLGALKLLDRDELQGVMAHEYSHLHSGDSRINLHLIGALHGLLLISLAGRTLMHGGTNSRKKGGLVFTGGALYLIGWIGVFMGRIIKAAIARKREELADAAAVQFTRNPLGLASALKKIGALGDGSRLNHPRAMAVEHMFFASNAAPALFGALSTHPPLEERIALLDPAWGGSYPDIAPLPAPEMPRREMKPPRPPLEPVREVSGAAAMAILESIGEPLSRHLERSRELLAGLPAQLREATRQPDSARALLFALLLSRDAKARTSQLSWLREQEPDASPQAQELAGQIESLPAEMPLLLLDLALPGLRGLDAQQRTLLLDRLREFSRRDGRISTFDLALTAAAARLLQPNKPAVAAQFYGIRGVATPCSLVLSLMAHAGEPRQDEARAAFEKGRKILLGPKADIDFLPRADCSPEAFEGALRDLRLCSPLIKKKLLAACLECLTQDGRIRVQEIELFRALAESLDCPVPLWAGSPTMPH